MIKSICCNAKLIKPTRDYVCTKCGKTVSFEIVYLLKEINKLKK